jgi:hypothetical protein
LEKEIGVNLSPDLPPNNNDSIVSETDSLPPLAVLYSQEIPVFGDVQYLLLNSREGLAGVFKDHITKGYSVEKEFHEIEILKIFGDLRHSSTIFTFLHSHNESGNLQLLTSLVKALKKRYDKLNLIVFTEANEINAGETTGRESALEQLKGILQYKEDAEEFKSDPGNLKGALLKILVEDDKRLEIKFEEEKLRRIQQEREHSQEKFNRDQNKREQLFHFNLEVSKLKLKNEKFELTQKKYHLAKEMISFSIWVLPMILMILLGLYTFFLGKEQFFDFISKIKELYLLLLIWAGGGATKSASTILKKYIDSRKNKHPSLTPNSGPNT